ncbi:MAG TPA: methyltransferase domain-containing protein [Candidatus Woesearchaeota archaeon]|nr:methyltransferase domain-containing protein [Candidatus Woesearchaeota archaeon]
MKYYNAISQGYEELYGNEQEEKARFLAESHRFSDSDRILDVGSGTGSYLKLIKGEKTCIDPSRELLKKNPYKKVLGKAERMPFADNAFDYCISLTAVQNFSNIKQSIKEMSRVCRKKIFISTMEKSRSIEEIERSIKELGLSYNKKRFKKEVFYFIELE